MAISKRVEKKEVDIFISKGGSVYPNDEVQVFVNVSLRLPKNLFEQVNEQIKKRPWMNRNAWIVDAIQDKIESIKEI